MLLKETVKAEYYASMWFHRLKKTMTSLIEDKGKTKRKGTHSLEPQKAHASGKFVIVA